MSNVIPFNTSGQVTEILAEQGTIGTYGDLALALQNNPGWRVIEGGQTVTNPAGATSNVVPISNYIKTTPELEGGVIGATEAIEVTEVTGGVQAASSGVFAGWTLGTAVAGILAGVGVGIVSYDLAPEFWTGLSNRIFGTDIDYNDIKDYRITGLIKDELIGSAHQNTTYLPYNTVQAILDYCSDYGIFNQTYSPVPEYEYEINNYYACHFGDMEKSLYSAFNIFLIQNSGIFANNDAANTFKLFFGSFVTWLINQLGSRNVMSFRFSAGFSGPNLTRVTLTVNASQASEPFNHRVGTIDEAYGQTYYTFNDINEIPNTYRWQFWANATNPTDPQFNRDYGWAGDGAYGVTSAMMGNKIESSDNNFFALQSSNIGYDYEYALPPGTYTLPDDPAVYDPTQTFPQQYPDWYNRLINTSGLQLPYDDPALYPIPWIPTVMPDYDPMTQPEKYPNPSAQPSPEPSPYPAQDPQPWSQTGKMPQQIPEPYPDPNPQPSATKNPQTGGTDPVDEGQPTKPTPTPTIVFPTVGGEANAIFTVYNPTLAQLNSLAGVLWSSNFLDNLIKIFTNNPMDAIISLHMLYATPTTGSSKEIVLGCYPTGVSATEVTKQYLEINCGTVRIPEYFGDARDYINTVVDVYLPFVGMRHLKTQDIIGSNVTIKACVDVFTGTILYTINIRKSSGIDQVMYAFEGNCAVQLPLTGADKSRMFSVLGAAATGAAVGGIAGAVGGAAMSAMNGSTQADIQRSGNFGSNAGAMGVKTPYIVVSRNIGYDSNNYNKYHGFPTNITVSLNSCSGYTKVLDCHLNNIQGATDTELQEIETLLKNGVII